MRALIISDIHANLPALEAVLACAPDHDVVWNLGDVVGYGANPNEVVDAVRQLDGIVVRGNHDRASCGKMDIHEFSQVARDSALWTRHVLFEVNRKWLSKLPVGPIKPTRQKVVCVHGSPVNEDDYLFFGDDAKAAFSMTSARIILFGHTHWQVGFSTRGKDLVRLRPEYGSQNEAGHFELRLRRGTRYALNPGSVGQPRDGDWRAAFALFDTARALFTRHRVPYGIETAQEMIRCAGLPDFLAIRLRRGK